MQTQFICGKRSMFGFSKFRPGFSDLWPVTKFGILSGSISRVGGFTWGYMSSKFLKFGLDPTLFTISTFKRKQIQN